MPVVRVGEDLPPLLDRWNSPRPLVKPAMMTTATLVQMLISLGVLTGLIVLAWIVVQRFRGGAVGEGHTESDLLTKFKEMRHEGDISETEYRTIKAVLGEQLQRDVKDGKNKG
jgi:hypothetical protein